MGGPKGGRLRRRNRLLSRVAPTAAPATVAAVLAALDIPEPEAPALAAVSGAPQLGQ